MAEREAARRDREETAAVHRWFALGCEDEWSLVKVVGVPRSRVRPLKGTVRAKPKPSLVDDPRPMSGAM